MSPRNCLYSKDILPNHGTYSFVDIKNPPKEPFIAITDWYYRVVESNHRLDLHDRYYEDQIVILKREAEREKMDLSDFDFVFFNQPV